LPRAEHKLLCAIVA